MSITQEQKSIVLDALRVRIKEHEKDEHRDNSLMPAGCSMVYYCELCRAHAATLPESHFEPAPRYCKDCARMFKEYGLVIEEIRLALSQAP